MKTKRPSIFLHLTELIRAFYEIFRGIFFLKRTKPSNIGKERPVLVIPGLLSTDVATSILRKYLNKIGFNALAWELGRNLGRFETLEILIEKVKKIEKEYQNKVILIGWSMGGIFAREIAKQIPESIDQVLTMGSPFADVYAPNYARWVFELLNKGTTPNEEIINQLPCPAPIKTTALFSKTDGIVPWAACMEMKEDSLHKNVEIYSCHIGMGMNPDVLITVKESLS